MLSHQIPRLRIKLNLESSREPSKKEPRINAEKFLNSYLMKMPDPCTISKRQGQIDRQGTGAIVSIFFAEFISPG